jgi:hypothetical protein
VNTTIYDSREIIQTYTLPIRITPELFQQNNAAYYITKNSKEKLFIEYNSGEIYVDRTFRLVTPPVNTENGLVYLMESG